MLKHTPKLMTKEQIDILEIEAGPLRTGGVHADGDREAILDLILTLREARKRIEELEAHPIMVGCSECGKVTRLDEK